MYKLFNSKNLSLLLVFLFLYSCHKETNLINPEKEQSSDAVLNHLLIEEINFSGTVYKKGGFDILYNYDNYIKITNPYTETLYLDSLLLAKCVFSSDQAYTLEAQNTRETHFPSKFILQFPGKGKDYPIKPGKSILIAASAFNHTTMNDESFIGNNPNSYDLSQVDFEWETEEQLLMDGEKPIIKDTPNLKILYSNGEWFKQDVRETFDFHTGKTSLALIKLNCSLNELKDNKTYHLQYQLTDKGDNYFHIYDEGIALNIPNDWVIDCVCLCPLEEYYRPTVGSQLDKGWTSTCRSSKKSDKEARGFSVFRKHDGNNFVDTNNSSIDFEIRQSSLTKKVK